MPVKFKKDCSICKWRFGGNKSKCKRCARASEFISFEPREEIFDGVYNTVRIPRE